jgi:hypothetical protein
MGLERILTIINNKKSVYETELFLPIIKKIEQITNLKYEDYKQFFRIISDHVRSFTFVLGDSKSIKPSNSGQGYVLRRLIRRTIRLFKELNINNNILKEISEEVINIYGDTYGELIENKEHIFIFESTYFIDSKELTLAADGIYHIPQEEQYITFDIKNKKLVDNAGYGIEYPLTVKENSIFDKDYNLRIDFNITDREIVENRKIKGALVDGIGFDYAVDEKGNKYDIKLSSNDFTEDNVIKRTLFLNTGKNSPQMLKFKIKYALKGTDGRINIKIK